MATTDDSLDSLLDNALADFKLEAPADSSRSAEPVGTSCSQEGLGKGLPSLQPAKKKTKQKSASSKNRAATLEKLAEQTRNTVNSIDTQPELSEEALMEMAKQFESLGTQDLESIMGTFMQQLLSKDILYEPMKEIGARYPTWLEANKSKISQEDYDRYSKQHELIIQLCRVYETTPDDFQKIVDMMQNMQSCGQPPAEMMEELAPGLQLGEDGLPVLPQGHSFPFPAGVPGMEGENANCCIM